MLTEKPVESEPQAKLKWPNDDNLG